MTKVMVLTKDSYDHNQSMVNYLKLMYYFGYLPFSWVSERDPEYVEIKFRISKFKVFIILTFDILLSLLLPAYFYLFNILNVDPNFNPKRLISPDYFYVINDGVETTAITQMAYVCILILGSWAYSHTG